MKKSSSTYFGIILICLIFLHSCTFTQIPDNFFSSATPKNNDSAGGINLGRTFSKLTKDKKLTIGFLGGSITQGDGASNVEETSYSALITKWFTKNYPQANIKSIIAGAPGTGSDLGAFYSIKALKKADLIFIEFAVNDYGVIKSFSNDDEKKNYVMRFTEGIIRGLLIENPAVEIAFIDVASKPTFENYELGTLPLVVQSHQELADHYTIAGQNYILYTNPGYAMFKYVNSSCYQRKLIELASTNIPTFSSNPLAVTA